MPARSSTSKPRKPATPKAPARKSPARKSPVRNARAATRPAPRRATKPSARPRPVGAAALPGWGDLAAKGQAVRTKSAKAERPGLVDGVPTLRFAVLLVAACALFTLYVGHTYATQALVEDVQALRKENLRLVLKHNRLRGEFDRMTAPAVILNRAAALGLEPSADYAPTISLND